MNIDLEYLQKQYPDMDDCGLEEFLNTYPIELLPYIMDMRLRQVYSEAISEYNPYPNIMEELSRIYFKLKETYSYCPTNEYLVELKNMVFLYGDSMREILCKYFQLEINDERTSAFHTPEERRFLNTVQLYELLVHELQFNIIRFFVSFINRNIFQLYKFICENCNVKSKDSLSTYNKAVFEEDKLWVICTYFQNTMNYIFATDFDIIDLFNECDCAYCSIQCENYFERFIFPMMTNTPIEGYMLGAIKNRIYDSIPTEFKRNKLEEILKNKGE